MPQLMPGGGLVTTPVPVPARLTVTVRFDEITVNDAVTDVLLVRFTVQVLVPLQPPPDHPANVDPDAGVAVSVTEVPLANNALHVELQLIP